MKVRRAVGWLWLATLAACDFGSSMPAPGSTAGGAAPPPPPATTAPDPHGQDPGSAPAPATAIKPSPGCYAAGSPRRLSRTQFVNALTDVSRSLTGGDGTVAARVSALVVDQAQFPPDQAINPDSARHQGYERIDQALNARQAAAIHASAKAIAAELSADPTRLSTMLGGCSGTPECLDAFIRRAGRLLFRQPLSDAEVAVYRAAAGGATTAAAITKVLATMIASPKTYFVLERGQTVDDGMSCAPLTAHELATRLALHLWDSVPDAALNAAADDGTLLDPAVYSAQISRMLGDAKADRAMRGFFRQWFRLDELVALDGKVGNARFDAFAAGYKPLASSRDAAITEVLDMVSYLAANNGSLQQVLTDRHSFARTEDIATLYKTPVWAGGSAAPPLFTEAARVGLLTRIGLMANGASDTTLPIQRASRILGGLTCQSLPPPVMDQSNKAADLSGVLSTRERTERITQMDGTSCVGCHKTVLNPWGFVFEGFDALGRVRSSETVRDDGGAVLGEKAVDTAVTAKLDGIAARPLNHAAEAQQYVLDSGAFERCFARHQVRYAFGRAETEDDAELIESLRVQAANGTNLRSLFALIAQRPEFKSIATQP
ncbi:DUF1592 domain-containing protein [Variovorax sp. YR752]|uniref:DUF1592 domain-containing protein n=1 Tax=Variovorax sp. YR752 TaxID=1884383 RepID=UPI00313822C3